MNNFDMMRRRLEYQGGIKQEDRMIRDKYKSFLKTLDYSYQAASISLAQHHSDCLSAIVEPQPAGPITRALINPDKVKQDYDDKIISVGYDSGLTCGDVIRWHGTDSYWIIYLEELSEDAYFRGEIRRCKYTIKFKDEEGNWVTTWAVIRGPVETQIDSIQKNQVRVDRPNLSLNILMPKNEKTEKAFDRYKEFLFAGRSWKVQAPDTISMVGVIEINAEESYVDRDTDDVLNEMKDGLVIEPQDPTPESGIHGETWIKPMIKYQYSVDIPYGAWGISNNAPVKVEPINPTTVSITWVKSTHGQFELSWVKDDITYTKVIVVESLF